MDRSIFCSMNQGAVFARKLKTDGTQDRISIQKNSMSNSLEDQGITNS